MSVLVAPETIEATVGAPRHETVHLARVVSAEQQVYILHSAECVAAHPDLTACPFSLALDRGLNPIAWWGSFDEPYAVQIDGHSGELVPSVPAEWVTS